MPLLQKEKWLPSFHSLWLLPILGAAAYLRLYHRWEPAPTYWDDFAQEIIAPRNVLDFHAYRWVFDLGRREPFFTYFTALLWYFLPVAKGLMVQRLSCVILDLLAVWVLYLLGKELSGRRAGVLLAAFGAVNLDLLLKCLVGMRIASLPLAVSLVLLYTLRMLRAPNSKHALQWGVALAFGLYTYTAFRAFPPVIVLGLWLSLVAPLRGVEGTRRAKFLSLSVLLLFFFYYAEGNNLVPGGLFGDEYLHSICLGALVFLIFVFWALSYVLIPPDLYQRAMVAWSGGVALASLLGLPMVVQRAISEHMAGLSTFTLSFHGVESLAAGAFLKVLGAFGLLVGMGHDRPDLGPAGYPMLEPWVTVLLVAGAVFAVRKMEPKGLWFFTLFLFGFLPYLLNVEPHSGKLSGVLIPALALAVYGVEALFKTQRVRGWGWMAQVPLLLVLAALVAWTASRDLKAAYRVWPAQAQSLEFAAYRQSREDIEDHFVYFGPFDQGQVSWESQGVLEEGRSIHPFTDFNTILLDGTQEVEGAVVYLPPGDNQNLDRIEKLHPCVLSDVKGPKGDVLFQRVEIPLNQIRKSRKKDPLFIIREVPEGVVHRRFYGINYGLGRGLARGEDWVEDANAPPPDWMPSGGGALVEWSVHLEDKKAFAVPSRNANPSWWSVDGQAVKGRRTLSPGNHKVDCFVLLYAPKKGLSLPASPVLSDPN